MKVGTDGSDPTIANALSGHRSFMLTLARASEICRQVAVVVDDWAVHFKAAGVSSDDLDLLGGHIDRDALRQQRGIALG